MKDRFEFRGYNKNLKKWFYGAYITQAEYADSPFEQTGTKPAPVNHFIAFEEMIDWGLPTKLKLTLVDKKSVGQCTGLKDRNGKLIFEGDIVRAESYPFYRKEDRKYNYYAEICWDEESASFFYYTFCISKDVQGISTGNTGEISEYKWEVIGNIYENKELLKEQK